MIYTFYSYKGGVGRSMALANVAELFYEAGLKVLMIDWDLEAPGLERFFPELGETLNKPGVIDILLGYKEQMQRKFPETNEKNDLPFEKPDKFMLNVHPNDSKRGKLWLIPAGKRSQESFTQYTNNVLTFDWGNFYEEWEGELYFKWLRRQFEAIADVILIDSRTGITEMGGVCTYQLADVVVALCATNEQNLQGTYTMVQNFKREEVASAREHGPLEVLVVPARLEISAEGNSLNQFKRDFLSLAEDFSPSIPILKKYPEILWTFGIPYIPYYAFKETVAVREREEATANLMVTSFERITRTLARLASGSKPVRYLFGSDQTYDVFISREIEIDYLYDGFISYDKTDQKWVRNWFLPRIQNANLNIIDESSFDIGVSILDNLKNATSISKHILLILSPKWIENQWPNFEELLSQQGYELLERERILPIIHKPLTLPLRISKLSCIDFSADISESDALIPILDRLSDERRLPGADRTKIARIYISYQHDVHPDDKIALAIYEALHPQHEVFMDHMIMVGESWAARIDTELRRTDFLIVLLSAESVRNEMVLAEITYAHRLAKEHGGYPKILPVRLAYREPFHYPLSAYLNPLNWASWEDESDTPILVEELKLAISGNALIIHNYAKTNLIQLNDPPSLPQPSSAGHLEKPEGTIDPESQFYIERSSDYIAMQEIGRQGVTMTIKAPRQMGKSSLLVRLLDQAEQIGKKTVFLDFQFFDNDALADATMFFRHFCMWLSDELDIDDQTENYWQKSMGNVSSCTRYISEYLLPTIDGPLVIGMDEVESIIEAEFHSEFFGMLRGWHNRRRTGNIWKQLDLVLVISTEPNQLISNINQSPFNVSEPIILKDFTFEQVQELNRRHGLPLTPAYESKLMDLLGGYPYLVRRSLYLVASGRLDPSALFATESCESLFADHLRYHLFRLHLRDDLIEGFRLILSGGVCTDDVFYRLESAGLVKREGRYISPRCRLYADFFKEHLSA